MTDEERKRLEEIRGLMRGTCRFADVVFLLDLVERQEKEIARWIERDYELKIALEEKQR